MQTPPFQFSVRRTLVAVALVAGVLGMLRLAYDTLTRDNALHESYLKVGQHVVIFSEGGTEVSTFVNDDGYAWHSSGYPPATTVPVGTRCLVVGEPNADEDDHDEHRPVMVKVVDGQRTGDLIYVVRNHLMPW
jgi:hypothetical protein